MSLCTANLAEKTQPSSKLQANSLSQGYKQTAFLKATSNGLSQGHKQTAFFKATSKTVLFRATTSSAKIIPLQIGDPDYGRLQGTQAEPEPAVAVPSTWPERTERSRYRTAPSPAMPSPATPSLTTQSRDVPSPAVHGSAQQSTAGPAVYGSAQQSTAVPSCQRRSPAVQPCQPVLSPA